MKPLRILFFTDNFPPESNAPANRTYEHCLEWVQRGAQVTVITCNPNFPKGKLFPGHKNKLYQTEIMNGIKVVRVWSWITPNRGTMKRILDYMSFAAAGFIGSLFHKTDVIVATSPQLFAAVGGYFSAVVKRKPWIMEVRDLWPESIHVLGAISNKRVLNGLERLVNHLYRKAHGIVVVTNSFVDKIEAEGIDRKKIDVVLNGVNPTRYHAQAPNKALLQELGLEGKFVVGYTGTHGMAHNLSFILDCAAKVTDPSIHFLFIGDGAMKTRLEWQHKEMGLSNVTMLPPVPREEMPKYLSIVDAALVPLRRVDTFKTVIPSKIFENAAMGKPILLGVEGEAKALVEKYHAGIAFEPENEADFLEKLLQLRTDEECYQGCCDGGLQLAQEFTREKLAAKMLQTIEQVAGVESVASTKPQQKLHTSSAH